MHYTTKFFLVYIRDRTNAIRNKIFLLITYSFSTKRDNRIKISVLVLPINFLNIQYMMRH